jgi:hypothetical protein
MSLTLINKLMNFRLKPPATPFPGEFVHKSGLRAPLLGARRADLSLELKTHKIYA